MTLFVILQITVRLTLKMNYAVHEVHYVYALYLKRFCAKMKGKAKTCLKAIKVDPSAKRTCLYEFIFVMPQADFSSHRWENILQDLPDIVDHYTVGLKKTLTRITVSKIGLEERKEQMQV
ncbi:unnamed protein product [Brugia pahangi]|uniref:AsnC_trans_reg domain-containing protein n=1 Tax=Brugia pahangi TaxID=6280 RepID=A0A0N4SXR2_BRUPA|nr:unnamed protein product [Brugia pahangi]